MPDTLTGESLDLANWLNDPTTLIVAHLSKHAIEEDTAALQLSDIVECDFFGYVPVRITNWTVFADDNPARGEAVSDPVSFFADGIVTPQAAGALYLTLSTQGDPAKIWRVFPFPELFQFDVDSRTLTKQVRVFALDDSTPPE